MYNFLISHRCQYQAGNICSFFCICIENKILFSSENLPDCMLRLSAWSQHLNLCVRNCISLQNVQTHVWKLETVACITQSKVLWTIFEVFRITWIFKHLNETESYLNNFHLWMKRHLDNELSNYIETWILISKCAQYCILSNFIALLFMIFIGFYYFHRNLFLEKILYL